LFVSCCFQLRAENVDKSGPRGSIFVFGDEFNAEVLDVPYGASGLMKEMYRTRQWTVHI
jgi:hypothetical protein